MPAKLKYCDVLKKLKHLHPKLDFSKFTEYHNSNHIITVKCKECGNIWDSNYIKLVAGKSCPKCAGNTKMSQHEFINTYSKMYPDYDFSGVIYQHNKAMFLVYCKDCNFPVKTCKRHLDTRGLSCPNCDGTKIYDSEVNFNRIKATSTGYDFSGSEYKGMNQPLKAVCKSCGQIDNKRAVSYLYKGCKNCYLNTTLEQSRSDHFKALQSKYNIWDYSKSEYKGIKHRINVTCKTCGESYELYHNQLDRCRNCYNLSIVRQRESELDQKVTYAEFRHIKGKTYRATCKTCGDTRDGLKHNILRDWDRCWNCNTMFRSKPEIDITEFIKKSYPSLKVVSSTKSVIHPYELDIYIPEIKLAIEFNGTYWHSDEKIIQRTRNKFKTAKEYHNHKTELCNRKRIKLIHIAEQDYYDRYEQTMSTIFDEIFDRAHNPDKTLTNFIIDLLGNYKIPYQTDVNIHGYGVSLFCPENNLAIDVIEFSKHNTDFIANGYQHKKVLHLSKKGVRLISGFEHYITDSRRRKVFFNSIIHACGKTERKLYARDTEVKILPAIELKQFFLDNNIQGYRSSKLAFCLTHKTTKEILMAYSIGGAFLSKGTADIEIARGAAKLGTYTVGGASKLWASILKYCKNNGIKRVVYYVDLNLYDSRSLKNLPDCELVKSAPSFWNYWVKTGEVKNRDPLRHKEITKFVKQGLVKVIPNAGTLTYITEVQ